MNTQLTNNYSKSFSFCRKVRTTRDVRYDGLLFSGSMTTKIYCRPTCPGKPPLESNNIYFHSRAQAEGTGYRPCLRCRPELAPDHPIHNTSGGQVRHALDKIHQGQPPDMIFTTSTDLRTSPPGQLCTDIQTTLGTSLTSYWKTFQLGFAKILVTDTALATEDISNICRFKNTEEMLTSLSSLYRRDLISSRKPIPIQKQPHLKSCALLLSYRPPFNWSALLDYYRHRSIARIEQVTDDMYSRSFSLNGSKGWFTIQNEEKINAIRLEVFTTDMSSLMELVWRVKRMVDIDADPLSIQALFGSDKILAPILKQNPGVRIPVAWNPFEYAVRAIAGQLISVTVATKLISNIVCEYAENLGFAAPKGIEMIFPPPLSLKNADMKSCGLTRNKITAIQNLAEAIGNGSLELKNNTDLDIIIRRCTALRGIGEWTAQTIALKGLGYVDAFPASDLGIVKALSTSRKRKKFGDIKKMAERWRPLRSYAAMLLWLKPTLEKH